MTDIKLFSALPSRAGKTDEGAASAMPHLRQARVDQAEPRQSLWAETCPSPLDPLRQSDLRGKASRNSRAFAPTVPMGLTKR
jgi:hypothetical protein